MRGNVAEHGIVQWDPAYTEPEQRARAARAVAASATDADDCRALLDALGLCPEEGFADRDRR